MTGKFIDRLVGIISEGTKNKPCVLIYWHMFLHCIYKDFRPYLKLVSFVVEMIWSHDGTAPSVTLKPREII